MRWFKCVWLQLFWHHSLHCNTACCIGLWTFMRMWIFFFMNVFQVSYIFLFVKCDVFVAIIWYQNIDRWSSLNVVYAIHNVYVGILPFCWFLIANETCCLSCDWVAFDFNWYDTIMSGRYLKCWLTIPIVALCLQFWVYVRNLPSYWI